MAKDFRFGVQLVGALMGAQSQSSVHEAVRRAEDLGFDVLQVPDHLWAAAPFPTLMSAAQATTTLRLGTFVLNAYFYKPALLARDVAAMRDLTGGRFELGLGTGYAREEFEAAELPVPTARHRVEHLEHVTFDADDRISAWREYFDSASVAQSMGVEPSEVSAQ